MEEFKTLKKRADKIQDAGESEKYRTLVRRLASGLIDAGFLMLPQMLLLWLSRYFELPGRYLFTVAITQLMSLIYSIWFVATFSTTPGKYLLGMKVLINNDEESTVGLSEAVRRELLNMAVLVSYLVMLIVYSLQGRLSESDQIMNSTFKDPLYDFLTGLGVFIGLSELVTALFSKKRRAVHDLIGGTVVVKGKIPNEVWLMVSIVVSVALWFGYFQVYDYYRS